jgi:hypothetical protein
MRQRSTKVAWALFTAWCALAVVAMPAGADHNDSTPIGLRITVTDVNPTTGTVEFDITVVDDDITDGVASAQSRPFDDIAIGTRFTYDRYTTVTYDQYVYEATNVTLPPAIDFGDGQTVPFARLPLVSDITADPGTFRGSFSHTYTTPGNYTITAFVAAVYGVPLGDITTGDPVSTGPATVMQANVAGTDQRTENIGESSAVGILNTAQVTIDLVSQVSEIPSLGRFGLLALGLALAALGVVVLRRLG